MRRHRCSCSEAIKACSEQSCLSLGHPLPILGRVLLRKNTAQICWYAEAIRVAEANKFKIQTRKYRGNSLSDIMICFTIVRYTETRIEIEWKIYRRNSDAGDDKGYCT